MRPILGVSLLALVCTLTAAIQIFRVAILNAAVTFAPSFVGPFAMTVLWGGWLIAGLGHVDQTLSPAWLSGTETDNVLAFRKGMFARLLLSWAVLYIGGLVAAGIAGIAVQPSG